MYLIVVLPYTYVLLLLVHVSDLKPDVLFTQRLRRVSHNVSEALPRY